MTTSTRPVRFNPFGAEFRRDPYPVYQRLRAERPVHKALGMWVLTRHADVRDALRDRTLSAGLIPQLVGKQAERLGHDEGLDRIQRLGRKSLVFTDNPDHARLRGLVNHVFTGPAVAALRARVSEVAGRLIERAWREGGFDVVADLAAPLPITVLGEWMELPDDLRSEVGQWTHDIRFLLEPGMMQAADFAHVAAVVERFSAALAQVIDDRRARPGDDLVSQLLAARTGGGDRLTDEEIGYVCIMCFVAGNETTKSLIGNAILALLSHPEQDAQLRKRPDLVPNAAAEALRFDSPLQLTKRLATRDIEFGGQTIPAGDQVLLCLGSANRDEAVFDHAHEFDITRDAREHLAFGHGMHGCLGGVLAQTQAETVLEHLYRRPERLRLDRLDTAELTWQSHSFIVRGLTSLPVTIEGRS